MIYVEIIGWLSTILIIATYTFKDFRKVRFTSALSSVFSGIYGVLIGAWAIVLLSVMLIVINFLHIAFKDKFASFLSKYNVPVFLAFICYCAVVFTITWFTTNGNLIEVFGMVSSVLFVCGFLQSTEKVMRTVCSIALLMSIAYALMIASLPILASNCFSLGFNIVRLTVLVKSGKKNRNTEKLMA